MSAEPAKLIEGITSDLNAAWKYLDQNYGDRRVVSDTNLDLDKFKDIQPGEDHRFCDLKNVVTRSYNILREIKRHEDRNNTHVISLIERKMTKEDIRVCVRHINSQNVNPTMDNLLAWMEGEMTARMRSGATICKSGKSSHSKH